ncbi:HAMP domain-containing sensor histidine kinase [Streptococcus hongkongensis]
MKNQESGQYKKSLPKSLSNLFFVLFFCIFSAFTLIAYYSTNYFLLKKEKQSVNQTVNIVRVRLSQVDSNFSVENLSEVLYQNSKENLKKDSYSGKNLVRSRRDLTNILDSNQEIYIYNTNKRMIFTTDGEETASPLKGPINRVFDDQAKGQYRGFSIIQRVYSKKTGKFLGYVQIYQDLEDYFVIRARLLIWLLFVELFGTSLAYFIIYFSTRRFLEPLQNLHDVMRTISENPNNLALRSKIKSGDEIEELSTIFDTMLDKVENYTNLQSRFISDVSHELRTPVAIIKGHIGLLQRWGKDDSEILEKSLNATAHEADRMAIMINDMLDMIRVQGSFDSHQDDTTNLESSIETVIGNFKVLREDFTFNWINPNLDIEARIYKNHFEQALMILIDNAIKYSQYEKEITIDLKFYSANQAIVTVSDKGEGISQEDIEHIFERFYRSDKSRNRTSTQAGLGIGLSILHQIVEGYNLNMEVKSQLNQGSTFVLYLPIVDPF